MFTRSLAVWSLLLFQNDQAPLESVKVEGSQISAALVQELAELRLGQAIDKAGIEEACGRLQATGLFSGIRFAYAPGPKHGYLVTLQLTDQAPTVAAAVDLPAVPEEQAWTYIKGRYPAFDHRIPQLGGVDDFLAKEIAQHFKDKLGGQRVVPREERDLRGRPTIVFQPEVLPRISDMTFSGNHEITSQELADLMRKGLDGAGFTIRSFRLFLDGAVRQAYEERGMYRVKFEKVSSSDSGPQSVAVATELVEGPKFTLGDVKFIGDNLPVDKMKEEARFKPGTLANWLDIQQGIYRCEKPVKRLGYYTARAQSRKILRDEQKQLDLEISIQPGPMFHFGELKMQGFPPDAEAKAREMWKMAPGSPFDYAYVGDFLAEFYRKVHMPKGDISVNNLKGAGDYVMDETLIFKPK